MVDEPDQQPPKEVKTPVMKRLEKWVKKFRQEDPSSLLGLKASKYEATCPTKKRSLKMLSDSEQEEIVKLYLKDYWKRKDVA